MPENHDRIPNSNRCAIALGLLEIKSDEPHRFGGLGTMIEEPSFVLSALPAPHWQPDPTTPWNDRIQRSADDWLRFRQASQLPNVRITVDRAPPPHAGFGSGTQLACCIASLLELAYTDQVPSEMNPRELAIDRQDSHHKDHAWIDAFNIWITSKESDRIDLAYDRLTQATQRGKRSHIGLAGFLLGGWIFDRGQSSGTDRWMHRKSPSDWRVILAQPNLAETIHGDQEAKMFVKSETHANPHRAEMIAMIESKILPGLECQSLQQVDRAIGQYGRFAGKVFKEVQHGLYRSKEVAEVIASMNDLGLFACGQSSWGPTAFAIASSLEQAESLLPSLRERSPEANWSISNFAAQGACFRILDR